MMRRLTIAALAAMLAACSPGDSSTPGATSADEDRQLNDAAAMLDINSVDADSLAPANDQEP